MSPRRSGDDPPLLDDKLVPEPPRPPAPPRRSPLAWATEANPRMADDGGPRPPSHMVAPEDQVGYLVAILMVIVGIVFAVEGGRPDAQPLFALAGTVVAAVLPVAIFRFANRFVSAVGAILAAFLISLGQLRAHGYLIGLYYILLIGALGYGFWLTRRQGKAARTQQANNRAAGGGRSRRGKNEPEPTGPPPNRRYTPPKAARTRKTRSEAAAAIAPEPSRRDRRRTAREGKDRESKDTAQDKRDKTAKSGR